MDTSELVEGGYHGLHRVEAALRAAGFAIDGIYLIRLVSDEGYVDWVMRLVTNAASRDVIYEYVGLKRSDDFPKISEKVRLSAVPPDHVEASRIIEYARRAGPPPVVIEGAGLRGLYIDYALVADYPQVDVALA